MIRGAIHALHSEMCHKQGIAINIKLMIVLVLLIGHLSDKCDEKMLISYSQQCMYIFY